MIIVDIEQGSEEWLRLRLGLVSASRFKDLMTEPKSKADKENGVLSATAKTYMMELIAEILTGKQKEISGRPLDWGKDNEKSAQIEYSFEQGVTVDEIGICLTGDKQIGASPDGFVGDYGGLEIKCPYNSAIHIATILSDVMPKEHMAQVQGNMLVNDRKWWDFVSYDPRIDGEGRIFITRINRDDEYIEKLQIKLTAFITEMKRILKESFGIEWNGVTVEESK
ncbi:MAG: YqaJ viral recombinase family protein [Planctomycetaceae bacterium]|nr:YqaJ viral recombinase family protein [Planctomycetaceae bacterium]